MPSYPAPISAVFPAKNTLHRLIPSLSCIMTGASHSSLERWAILSEIREKRYTYDNKERISQVKIFFKQKLFLEIAGHVSELNRSKKNNFSW